MLVAKDPEVGGSDADRLELLTLLVEDFERRQFQFKTPDAIDAIAFRMEEQQLRQRDLVPMLGSASRVSEVLNGKRPLTVQMIRALSDGLGIPLDALIQTSKARQDSSGVLTTSAIDPSKFPLTEMKKRGWFDAFVDSVGTDTEELVRAFLAQVSANAKAVAMYRRTFKGEELDPRSYYSTLAWTARVLIRAKQQTGVVTFDIERLTSETLRSLARLSWFGDGPRLAVEFLSKLGIIVVVEPRLPNLLVDGAAMLSDSGTPVIGLTLRYDRLDYFWFTLLHEVAHVWRHLNSSEDAYIDRVENMESSLIFEKEANRIARDSLVPRGNWKRSRAFLAPSRETILEFANEMHVHPAIVVGRLHFESGRYESFRDLVGQGLVHKCFPEFAPK